MCGAKRSGLCSIVSVPAATSSISAAGSAIIASMNRSSSTFDSLSVGSDHQRARDGEADRRRVETEVDQALGDVIDRHAGLLA